MHLFEIGSSDNHRVTICGTGDGIREGSRDSIRTENRSDGRESIGRQVLPVLGDHHDVGAIFARLAAQLGLHIHIKIEHGGGNSGSYHHRQQGRGGAATSQDRGAHQHT